MLFLFLAFLLDVQMAESSISFDKFEGYTDERTRKARFKRASAWFRVLKVRSPSCLLSDMHESASSYS